MQKPIRMGLVLAFGAALLAGPGFAQDRTIEIQGGQASSPTGVLFQVRSVRVSPDATVLHVVASFDSQATNSVNLNDGENAYLSFGEDDSQRLHLRQIEDNPWLRISNGETLEGDLVFPGALPQDATQATLVLNPGNEVGDPDAPGLTLPLALTK